MSLRKMSVIPII